MSDELPVPTLPVEPIYFGPSGPNVHWRDVACIDCTVKIPDLVPPNYMLDPESRDPLCKRCAWRRVRRERGP